MSIQYSNYKNIDKLSWEDFTFKHKNSNIFHSIEFTQAIEKLKNCQPLVFSQEKDGEIVALAVGYVYSEFSNIIYKNLTKRALFQGGILFSERTDISAFLNKLIKYCKGSKAIYSSIIQYSLDGNDFFKSLKYEVIPKYNYMFSLDNGIEPIWNAFKSKKRQNIRKADKNGLIVREGCGDDLREVYDCIAFTYNKIRIPVFDFDFLKTIFLSLVEKEMIKIYLVKIEDKIIATRISLFYNDKAFDWYAGSLDGYNKYNVNDVLVWESLKGAHLKGCNYFDFGGAGLQGEKYGVRDFKSKFGGKLISYNAYKKIHNPIKNNLLLIGKKLL